MDLLHYIFTLIHSHSMSDILTLINTQAQNSESLVYAMAFLFASIESTIGLSMLVPGSLTLMVIGAISALGAIKIWYILPIAIFGAVVGDNLSYFLGRNYGRKLIKKIKFIDQKALDLAEEFIQKHGAKSVFLGRFVPFIKETIPFISGSLKMDRRKFLLFNALGAVGWALAWPGSGYLFAKAILAGSSTIIKIEMIFAMIIVSYLAYFFFTDFIFKHYQTNLKNNFLKIIKNKKWLQLITTIVILFMMFNALAISILEHKHFIQVMDYLGFRFLFSYFNSIIFALFMIITWSAKWYIVVIALLALSVLFYEKHRIKFIVSTWVTIVSSAFAVYILKNSIARPRPEYAKIAEHSYSFPSGHATIATALAGILIYLILQTNNDKLKKITIPTIILWAILIYVSRIYIGVHYLSDIIGGIIIGAIFATLGSATYRWLENKESNKYIRK